MPTSSTLTRDDYENYLVWLYFGADQDLTRACIKRAYRDFSRTLSGFGSFENKESLKRKAEVLLKESLDALKLLQKDITATVFDDWHRETCKKIISLFADEGFPVFVGQAQKWVNMTLKYIFTLGEKRVQGFEFIYSYCHVPFDKILLARLEKYGFPALDCAWSRLNNYDEYLEKQNWLRQRFSLAPMDVEFLLWMEKEVEG